MPRRSRGPVFLGRRSSLWILAVALVVVLELAGTLAVPTGSASGARPLTTTSFDPATHASAPAVVTTHGDLDVAAGKTVYLPAQRAPSGQTYYYQGGNISVAKTGTLIVTNTTLSIVQFIGTSGVPAVRLSHVFRIVNHGTIILRNSTLTTTTYQLNAFPKLTIVNDGLLSLFNSSIRTAGMIQVGTGGVLTLNGSSSLRPNPNASQLTFYKNDTALISEFSFAPSLDVSGGGQANLFASSYRGLYSDNFTANATPVIGPRPVNGTDVPLQNGENWTRFTTGGTPQNLLQDVLYPSGISGGTITLAYNDLAGANTKGYLKVWYAGVEYGVKNFTVPALTSGTLSFQLPANLTAAISAAGMEAWLNNTGAFGTTSHLAVNVHVTAGPAVPDVNVTFQLQPLLQYGPVVSGAGSRLSAVDSFIGLNFTGPFRPAWAEHNLTVAGGASAYLANLTVRGRVQNNTTQFADPAIVVTGTSSVYLYRWAQVQLTGRNNVLPVPNATLSENYAYGLPQTDNTTAASANALKTADPAIYGYLQYWQTAHSISSYGKSNSHGVAAILLATNYLYAASSPDGDFLGDYHVTVTPPLGLPGTRGFNVTLPAYPIGVAYRSTGYGEPTSWGKFLVPGYYAQGALAAKNGIVITANGVKDTDIRIGQTLGVAITVVNTGTAPITSLEGTLLYNNTVSKPTVLAATLPIKVDLGPGSATPNATLQLNWVVNETVVGHHGKPIADTLYWSVVWNLASPVKGGGTFTGTQAVQFDPSSVTVSDTATSDASCLSSLNGCSTSALIMYNGTESASVTLTAIPISGSGAPVVLGESGTRVSGKLGQSSTVAFTWFGSLLTPGTTYQLTITASYNGVSVSKTLATQYEVPAPSTSNIWSKKFLGEPLWVWLAIVAAVIVGIIAFLLVSRRQAAGKLVECGECGNLIPEEAKVCPKCGAEFESDVIRCSRCSSTIPADSKFCPECAAQLLGKVGEGGQDPERQAYSDFTERYRAEAKKELGENYSEGSFWDWWKRQASYTPFSQWKLQQGQGTPRTGMSAPPAGKPPAGGASGAGTPAGPRPSRPGARAPPRTSAAAPPPAPAPPPAAAPPLAAAETTPTGGNLKPCPNCGKEIPPEYLVCPFCGSVTQ